MTTCFFDVTFLIKSVTVLLILQETFVCWDPTVSKEKLCLRPRRLRPPLLLSIPVSIFFSRPAPPPLFSPHRLTLASSAIFLTCHVKVICSLLFTFVGTLGRIDCSSTVDCLSGQIGQEFINSVTVWPSQTEIYWPFHVIQS